MRLGLTAQVLPLGLFTVIVKTSALACGLRAKPHYYGRPRRLSFPLP